MSDIFDRTADVSKLIGCNTRNVSYRWDIFDRRLATLQPSANALDFGAGSLRDSWELARRGLRVTSLDLDGAKLQEYARRYDWNGLSPPTLSTDSLEKIPADSFDLVLAFDVIEHLEDPAQVLTELRRIMAPRGCIFCTVPNKYTLSEQSMRVNLKMARKRGRTFPPGVPHLQFRGPGEWRKFFEENVGLRVAKHDMAIGPLVNTWYTFIYVSVMLCRRATGHPRDARIALRVFAWPPVMKNLDLLDRLVSPLTRRLHAWNLMILEKNVHS